MPDAGTRTHNGVERPSNKARGGRDHENAPRIVRSRGARGSFRCRGTHGGQAHPTGNCAVGYWLAGYEWLRLAQAIRHEAWGKDLTLIAVTGWGQDADKRRALAAGFDEHLTKPIDPAQLKVLAEN